MQSDKPVGLSTPGPHRVLAGYAIIVALIHLWYNTLGQLSSLHLNALHLGLFLSFIFLDDCWKDLRRSGLIGSLKNGLLAALALLGGLYVIFGEEALHQRGEVLATIDVVLAATTVVLALLACYRRAGWVMPILVVLAFAYVTFLGRYLPGVFHFRGLGIQRVLYRFYFSPEGMFGMIADISASYVFLFILFAAFLLRSGGADFILAMSRRLTGGVQGGSGFVAVFSSALMGTVTGSAVANTVSTGSITIPMMKKAGYSPIFAAATEVAASTGGQLTPPIMGAGAFIMAQWTGLPYSAIISAALLPALLYFISVFFAVYFEAKKTALETTPLSSDESTGSLLLGGLHFFIPLAVVILLLVEGFSPTYSAGLGIGSVVIASWLSKERRMGLTAIGEALELGTRNMAPTAILLLCSGMVIGAINMTGVSVAFSQTMIDFSGGILLLAIGLIALASLFLGMGLPVTAAYVMLAVVSVPALSELLESQGNAGEDHTSLILVAHFIVFWLSQDSTITPPVCLAAFAGAAIAGSPPVKTGVKAWMLAKGLYLIPILFAYTELITGGWDERLKVFAFALPGLLGMTAALSGYLLHPLLWWERVLLVVVGLVVLYGGGFAQLAGVIVLAGFLGWSFRMSRRADLRH